MFVWDIGNSFPLVKNASWEKKKFYSQIKKIYLVVNDHSTRR